MRRPSGVYRGGNRILGLYACAAGDSGASVCQQLQYRKLPSNSLEFDSSMLKF